jgi:Predicted metal-dependent phosphoesterases (PHP family)
LTAEIRKRSSAGKFFLPATISAIILVGAFFARSPVVAADSASNAAHASLRLPVLYDIIAPVSNIFDALTLLTIPQVLATFGFGAALLFFWRNFQLVRVRGLGLTRWSVWGEIRFVLTIIGSVVAIAGLALLLPRPMAALHLDDPDLLAVDFHSHTSASHDGRPSFTPEANREWHHNAGFDVGYVTDHHTFAGAFAAEKLNPKTAGEGTVLLRGIEFIDDDEHLIALGLDPVSTNVEIKEWHPVYRPTDVSGWSPRLQAPALLILALPGDLRRVPEDEELGSARLTGIELAAGSPQGFSQAEKQRAAILGVADSMNLATMAGSDNHGWTHAAGAWGVMRIPGWRKMTAPQLDEAIRWTIATERRAAIAVIARRTVMPPANRIGLALTAPQVAWEIATVLSWPERLSWIAWSWLLWVAATPRRKRRMLHYERVRSLRYERNVKERSLALTPGA